MKGSSEVFEPVCDAAFVAGQETSEPVTEAPRDTARSNWCVFRARNGTEVAVPKTAIERMVAFGKRTEPSEWYALLVGRLFTDTAGTHVVIDGVVFDAEAEATRSSIRTTPSSEFHTRQLAAFQHPGSIPIGWAHGHVKCEARYSSVDRDNQKSWTQPHSVGIVVDPWDPKLLAVYLGPESELLEPVSGMPPTTLCAGTRHVSPAAIPPESSKMQGHTDRTSLAGWFAAWSVPFVALAIIGFGSVNSLMERVDALISEVRSFGRSTEQVATSPSRSTSEHVRPTEPAQCAFQDANDAEESGWTVPLALQSVPSSLSTSGPEDTKRSVAPADGLNGSAKRNQQAGAMSSSLSRKTDLARSPSNKRPAGTKQASRSPIPAASATSKPSESGDAPISIGTQQQQRTLP